MSVSRIQNTKSRSHPLISSALLSGQSSSICIKLCPVQWCQMLQIIEFLTTCRLHVRFSGTFTKHSGSIYFHLQVIAVLIVLGVSIFTFICKS